MWSTVDAVPRLSGRGASASNADRVVAPSNADRVVDLTVHWFIIEPERCRYTLDNETTNGYRESCRNRL